jgi:hypothetical protein
LETAKSQKITNAWRTQWPGQYRKPLLRWDAAEMTDLPIPYKAGEI